MNPLLVELSALMVSRGGSVDPRKHANETFELLSIPAYDRGLPDVVAGESIGSTKQVVQSGDVLLSKIVPHIRRAWVVPPRNSHRQIASGEWIVFRDEQIHGPYFRQLLVSDAFNNQFMQTVAGVGGSLLRARPAHVAKIKVPLPPLEEQRRIAAILDKTDELRDKRREALVHLDTFTQAIFHKMFGDYHTPRHSLGSLLDFRYGTSNKAADTGLPTLRIPNIVEGVVDTTDPKLVPVSDAELERLRLLAGDLLFVRSNGNRQNVGRCAVFQPERMTLADHAPSTFIYASYLIRGRLKGDHVHPIFLQTFLSSQPGREMLLKGARTSAGQYNINTESLGGMRIPVPPIEMQNEFVARVSAVERLKEHHRAQLTELDTLFACLQHRAFKGEL